MCSSIGAPRPGHRRHAVQAVGPAHAHHRDAAAGCSSKWSADRRRADRGVPAAAAAGRQGLPIQFVISTTEPFENLNEVAQEVLQEARDSGMFFFVDTDLKIDKPQTDRRRRPRQDRAARPQEEDVGSALGAALGGGYVNYFSIAGRSYKVIPQVLQTDRLNPDQVLDYYSRTPGGASVPPSTVATHRQEHACPSRSTTSSSSTRRRSRASGARRVAGRRARLPARTRRTRRAAGLHASTTPASRGSSCRSRAASSLTFASR